MRMGTKFYYPDLALCLAQVICWTYDDCMKEWMKEGRKASIMRYHYPWSHWHGVSGAQHPNECTPTPRRPSTLPRCHLPRFVEMKAEHCILVFMVSLASRVAEILVIPQMSSLLNLNFKCCPLFWANDLGIESGIGLLCSWVLRGSNGFPDCVWRLEWETMIL